jgi:hypothetical protein
MKENFDRQLLLDTYKSRRIKGSQEEGNELHKSSRLSDSNTTAKFMTDLQLKTLK